MHMNWMALGGLVCFAYGVILVYQGSLFFGPTKSAGAQNDIIGE